MKLYRFQIVVFIVLSYYSHVYCQDSWMKKADLPMSTNAAVGFSLNGYGFIGTGYNTNGVSNDIWRFDPTENRWEKASERTSVGLDNPDIQD